LPSWSENKNARLVTRTQRHLSHADPDLPAPVRELAQAILDQPHVEQLPLF
jgi:hypothetical protein